MQVGIDLGGTKTEILVLDKQGQERFRKRVATPHHHYDDILKMLVELVQAAEHACGSFSHIGIGAPGAISTKTGLMKNSNTTCLNGKPLLVDLQNTLQKNIKIANDANCFTLSEAKDGAATQARVVFGVIVGTGTGGGVVVDGRVLTGPNAIAGEWGHNPLPWPMPNELPGPACYCGQHGCIETFLSGPGLVRDHDQACGEKVSAEELVTLDQQGHLAAKTTWQRYEQRMARALASVINILDPDVIVLGGGLSNVERLYKQVPKLWGNFIFSDHVATRLVKNKHGDSSGVRGAAWLWD